jgi:glucuronoarabinoxylan endo-1,4-beta-xylanase
MEHKDQHINGSIICKLLFVLVIILLSSVSIHAQNEAIIDLDSTHQIIRGFGAANILPWRADMTEDEINTAFGTGDGQIGFSILRLRVPLQADEFDINLHTAQLAHSMGVTLTASPWSPPAYMKTNNNSVGGELDEAYYDEFAVHLDSFSNYMAENDAPIYAVSVQNEPDVSVTYESCDYNASQMLRFVKENAQSIGTKVMAPESYHFAKSLSDPILNDPVAVENLDIVCGHIYGGGLVPYPLAEEKGKEIWMTEHLTESLHSGNIWSYALDVAEEMQQVMLANMNAYIWWYIVRYYGPIGDGEVSASFPDEDFSAKGEITKKGYVMSQFARFIRPGYWRVECTANPQSDVSVTAYKDSISSKVVIVAINNSSEAKAQTFTVQNVGFDKFTPYVTSETKDCNQEEDILVSDGSFSATLEGSSITTFVSGSPTSVVEHNLSTIKSFKLAQNYPNPFNPSTRINFEIPKRAFVSLKVYDILGKEIDELAGKDFNAGIHSVTFDGSHLANGIYFYTLRAGEYKNTKKMFIIK